MENDQNQLNTQSAADIDLVQSAKQGDISAFEELVRRHTKRVFAIASHITRSREDAEEVSQETFLKACRHLKGFEGKAQFGTWLTRIAVNTGSRVRYRSTSRHTSSSASHHRSRSPNAVISASAARSRPTLKYLFGSAVLSSQLHLELPTFPACAGNKRR